MGEETQEVAQVTRKRGRPKGSLGKAKRELAKENPIISDGTNTA